MPLTCQAERMVSVRRWRAGAGNSQPNCGTRKVADKYLNQSRRQGWSQGSLTEFQEYRSQGKGKGTRAGSWAAPADLQSLRATSSWKGHRHPCSPLLCIWKGWVKACGPTLQCWQILPDLALNVCTCKSLLSFPCPQGTKCNYRVICLFRHFTEEWLRNIWKMSNFLTIKEMPNETTLKNHFSL